MALPVLSGLKVIAVEQYGAGPYGSMQLADLGAEVSKIENPADDGDMSRRVGPYFQAPNDSHFFHSFNRNKRSITLDLKKPAARRVLHRAGRDGRRAARQSARGSAGEARADLRGVERRPTRRSSAPISRPMAARDRARHWPGYDYLMQAEAGYLAVTGEPDGPPARMGLSLVDLMTGLLRRLRAGLGRAGGARERRGARPRCQPVRYGAAEPRLSGDLVSQRRARAGPRAALGPPVAGAEPALPHRATATSSSCATRRSSGRSCASGWATRNGPTTRASAPSRTASPTASWSPRCSTTRCRRGHDRMAGAFRRAGAGRAGQRRAAGARQSVCRRARPARGLRHRADGARAGDRGRRRRRWSRRRRWGRIPTRYWANAGFPRGEIAALRAERVI